MSAELIYKTESPVALAWLSDFEARRATDGAILDAFQAEVTAALGAMPDSDVRRIISSRGKVVGVERSRDEWERRSEYSTMFPGWREHPRWDAIIPKLNSKAGKAWKAKIDALPILFIRDEIETIGVPSAVFADSHMYEPGIDFDKSDDGTVTAIYVSWGSGQCEAKSIEAQQRHPEVVWTEVKRSEWYAREESKAANQ